MVGISRRSKQRSYRRSVGMVWAQVLRPIIKTNELLISDKKFKIGSELKYTWFCAPLVVSNQISDEVMDVLAMCTQ